MPFGHLAVRTSARRSPAGAVALIVLFVASSAQASVA